MIDCPVCGVPFLPVNYRQKYCSIPCRHRRGYDLMVVRFGPTPTNKTKYLRTAECKWCGHRFSRATVTRKNMNSCSDNCRRWLIATSGGVRRLTCKIYALHCGWCGEVFSVRKARKYCSSRCASKSGYESGKAKRLAILRERYVPKPARILTCAMCEESFSTKQGQARYCSKCGAINAKVLKRDHNKRRDAQKRGLDGVTTEHINVAYIYDRDAWRCGVCGKRVDKALTYPHPMSASLDHIVPLAHSGTHTKANTQLAHLICNVRKSDRLDVQPLLFG